MTRYFDDLKNFLLGKTFSHFGGNVSKKKPYFPFHAQQFCNFVMHQHCTHFNFRLNQYNDRRVSLSFLKGSVTPPSARVQ